MHEINEAAEVITGAVDPDANIIFGATLKDDMKENMSITVIATGFDVDYFSNRSAVVSALDEEVAEETATVGIGKMQSVFKKPAIDDMVVGAPTDDDEIDEPEAANKAELDADDEPSKDDSKDAEPASVLSRHNSAASKSADSSKSSDAPTVWTYDADDDKYDKPSFLRRMVGKGDDDVEVKDD